METLSYGLELEIPLIKEDGTQYYADKALAELFRVWQEKGYKTSAFFQNNTLFEINYIDTKEKVYSTQEAKILAGYDCVPSTVEFSIGPFTEISNLHNAVQENYNTFCDILAKDKAYILNFSENPHCALDINIYNEKVLDKALYLYIRDIRGHAHYLGMDGKTQTSPSTGIKPKDALRALNLIVHLSPVFIALFANSPYENKEDTGVCENRLSLWEREFATSIYKEDQLLHIMPEKGYFSSLKDYFLWLYGRNVPCYGICTNKEVNDKKNRDLAYIPSTPDLLTFLRKDSWQAKSSRTHEDIVLKPHLQDFIEQQSVQHIDARLRFHLDTNQTSLKEFFHAFDKHDEYFDDYFTELLNFSYIENRVPGSNSPDISMAEHLDADILNTVHSSSFTLQAGILRACDEIENYLKNINYYNYYNSYREGAIKKALHMKQEGISLHKISTNIVNIASKYLSDKEEKYLAYIKYNLETQECGADRARKIIQAHTHKGLVNWKAVLTSRRALKYRL